MITVTDIEPTPNPDALKFVLSERILNGGVKSFDKEEDGKSDALAAALFSLKGVSSVFFMSNFVTISKKPDAKWSDLQNAVIKTVQTEAKPATEPASGSSSDATSENSALLQKINQVIDDSVRPALAGDGGGIEVLGLDGYNLTIHYQGACGSCPSSTAGTMFAVQNLLQRMVDARIRVVSA